MSLSHEALVRMTAERIATRFKYVPPPKAPDSQWQDSLGRPVHYNPKGRKTGLRRGSKQIAIVSDAGAASRGGMVTVDGTRWGGAIGYELAGKSLKEQRRIIAEHIESLWPEGRGVGGAPSVSARDYSSNPIVLRDVDPYGREILCGSRRQAQREVERHNCEIKKGPGE